MRMTDQEYMAALEELLINKKNAGYRTDIYVHSENHAGIWVNDCTCCGNWLVQDTEDAAKPSTLRELVERWKQAS